MPPTSGRGLASWPIRRKLVALVIVPVVVILATGALLAVSSVSLLRQAERTRTLATTALADNIAIVAVDNELNQTIALLQAENPETASSAESTQTATTDLQSSRDQTDKAFADLRSYLDDPPSGGWSSDVLLTADGLDGILAQLTSARESADNNYSQVLVDQHYEENVLSPLRGLMTALTRDIATASGSGDTIEQASTLNALTEASFSAADERIRGAIALGNGSLNDAALTDLRTQQITQDAQLSIALAHATPGQQADITALRNDDAQLAELREDLIDLNKITNLDPDIDREADEADELRDSLGTVSAFVSVTGQRLDTFDGLIGRVAQETRDSAAADVRSALLRTIAVVGLGLITLMLVFAALAAISRTITIPMRRLRSGAVEVATVRLPAAVRTIEQHGAEAHIDLPPVMPPGLVVGPETVEVAHAVDGLTAEAVRLATSQVRLRHALDEAFVSMSRRSQSMVEKQLTIIDELESVEEDPEQLRNLFRLDHLAARMRRYNDNLLVLAGSTVRTRSNTPVPIADVFRAATSEMEQYERVRLQPVGSASVGGQVAGGLIHLLAELLDNAAMYSPPTSPILLTAEFTSNGGLHLEVTDSGVGIPPAELAELNSRLATPGTIDTQIPSRMGLFVVGRLAHRGGFEVRLSPRPTGAGTVAEVLVPTQHVIGAEDSPGSEQAAPPARRPESTPDHFGGVGFSQQSSSQPFPEPSSPAMPAGPEPSWPPAAAAAPLASVVPPMPRSTQAPAAAPLEAGDGLPSRVPGAALSSGPLGGTSPVKEPASQFDAFGMKDAPPPPEEQSTATALWSQRSRTEDMGQDGESSRAGSGPFGMPAETPVSDPFGIGSFNGRSVTSPSGIPLSPAASGPSRSEPSFDLPSSGRLPFSSPPPSEQPPSRPPFGSTPDEPWMRTIHSAPADDPWAGQQLPRREASGGQDRPSAPEPLFGQGLHSPGDTGGFTPPVDRMTPLTGELPWQEVAKSAAPNPQIPTPSWQQAVPEPPPFDPGPSPLEQAAYDATAYGQSSADLDDPLTGHFTDVPQDVFETPIFDSISLWFNDETTAPSSPAPAAPEPVEETWGASGGALGRRAAQPAEPAAAVSGLDDLESRWASLGDQQWMATNARAAAQPEVAGDTSVGLPRRQPGANLLPSASAAAPTTTPSVPAPFRRADADTVRGRLGSYQRGVSSARRSRQIPTGGTAAGLFTAARTSTEETGHSPENHGGQE